MKTAFAFGALALIVAAGAAIASPTGASHDHSHGHETAWGKPGDPAKPARIIQVVMNDTDGRMSFVPERIEVRRGEQIRFRLRNNGLIDHEFVLATTDANLRHAAEMQKNPDMEHDDPNARRLTPDQAGDIVWAFTQAGVFDYSCLIPGHREAGMTGVLTVR